MLLKRLYIMRLVSKEEYDSDKQNFEKKMLKCWLKDT